MLMHPRDIQDTADSLRARIASIERGELIATPEHETFLRGALEALNGILGEVAP